MATSAERLMALQVCDLKVLRLRKESEDIPARKKQIEDRNEDLRKAIQAARDEQAAQQARAGEIELEVESRKEKIGKLREQQMGLKTNEEFRAMEKEIANVQGDIRKIEDQELEVMEGVEAARARVGELEEQLQAAEEETQRDMAAMDERKARLDQELAAMQAERETLAAEVDPDWLRAYQRIFEHRQGQAACRVEHGVCGSCHMKLPPQVIHNAARGDMLIACDYCGTILC